MEEDFRIGDNVLIVPMGVTGIVESERTAMSNYWVNYDNEYGGLYWYHGDLKLIEPEVEF